MSVALRIGTGTILSRTPAPDVSKVVVDIGQATILSRTPQDADQAVPWWNEDPASWEGVVLNGTRLPGLSWITGSMGIRVSRKKVGGVHGHTVIQFGYEPGKLSVKLVLWTKQHLIDWVKQLETLRPKPGRGQPSVVSISHPSTQMMGVSWVEVINIGLLEQDEPSMDSFNCKLELRESISPPTAGKAKVKVFDVGTVPTALPIGTTTQKTQNTPTSKTAVPPSQTNGGTK